MVGQTGTIVASHSTVGRWQRVSFETPFALTPIVITQLVSAHESVPVSIRKVTRRGFEFALTGQRGETPERVSYLAVARGVHELSGSLINAEAGFVAADASSRTVPFDHAFTGQPIVLAQSQTHNSYHEDAVGSSGSIDTQIEVTGADRFSVHLHDRRRYQRSHPSETVGYLAFEPGAGVLDPPGKALDQLLGRFEIATAPKSVTDPWHQLVFEQTYDQPILLAGLQERTEHGTVATRVANLDSGGAAIRTDEDHNDRTTDPSERIGYAIFENEHLLYV